MVEPGLRSRCHVLFPFTKNSSLSGDQSIRTVWNWSRSSGSELPPGSAVPVPHECFAECAIE